MKSGAWLTGRWYKVFPTALLFIFAIWFSYSHASSLPYGDEYELVEVLVGYRSFNWSYLISKHNEHRLPVPRLLIHTMLPIYGYDFKFLAASVPGVIAFGLFVYLWAKVRTGRSLEWSDNAYAALLFNPGHVENYLWGWQIQYAANIGLVFLIAGLLWFPRSRIALVSCCICVILLMGCGVNGVLTAMCLWIGTSFYFGVERRWDWGSIIYLSIAVIGLFLSFMLIRTGGPVEISWSINTVTGMLAFFACLAGPVAQSYWQTAGFLASLILAVATCYLCIRTLQSRKSIYILPICLILSLFLFALAVGLRRTAGEASDAFQYRYFTLTTVWLIAAFAIAQETPSVWSSRIRWALLAITIGIGVANVTPGFRYATAFNLKQRALEHDLESKLPLRLLADKYHSHPFGLYAPSSQILYERLDMLRLAEMTRIKVAVPSPKTLVVDSTSDLLRVDKQSGGIRFVGSQTVHGVSWRWAIAGANGDSAAAFGVFANDSDEKPVAGIVRPLIPFLMPEAIQIDAAVKLFQFGQLAREGELTIKNFQLFIVDNTDGPGSAATNAN